MSNRIKKPSQASPIFFPHPSPHRKILPLKHKFFTFQSEYDYRAKFQPTILSIRSKNPKWCHLSLKLGQSIEDDKPAKLRRACSLRLRSVHLENFSLDSQGSGDNINGYFGQLDTFARAGNTLKKLSLSVVHDFPLLVKYKNPKAGYRLNKFVKKQKHLDEFGIFLGSTGNAKWNSRLLSYAEKTVKILTIANLTLDDIFKKHHFLRLETVRFEYIAFYKSEDYFDFAVLKRTLKDVLALPSVNALIFSQYQRYQFWSSRDSAIQGLTLFQQERYLYYCNTEETIENGEEIEFVSEFWDFLRAELERNKEKPLRIKYHRKDDLNIEEKVENFKRVFQGLPQCQTFEYEIMQFFKLSNEEIKAKGLELEHRWSCRINFHHYWKGIRYLISLGEVESF